MPVTVRPLRADEGHIYLDIVARAVRGLAASHYAADILEAWAPSITHDAVDALMLNEDGELRLVAELDGRPAGIGALIVATSELRACYVAPEAARRGCGSALIAEIERLAQQNGLTRLHLLASLNAEPFYTAHGYEVREPCEHVLASGRPMAALRMEKNLK